VFALSIFGENSQKLSQNVYGNCSNEGDQEEDGIVEAQKRCSSSQVRRNGPGRSNQFEGTMIVLINTGLTKMLFMTTNQI